MFIIGIILFSSIVFAESYWVDDPNSCPDSYQSQTCSGSDIVCGADGGVTYCYGPGSLNAPGSSSTSNSNVDDGSFDGGYLIDCYAYDGSEPHCDNTGSFWCDRNSSCYGVGRDTSCTADAFGETTCGDCRSTYFECDGSITDSDGCEILGGSSCGSGTGTVETGECFSSTQGNCTRISDYLDCDNDDGDGSEITCNGANGCEVNPGSSSCDTVSAFDSGNNNHLTDCSSCSCDSGYLDCDGSGTGSGNGCEVEDGGSCTVGGLSGTYDDCTCVVDKSYFETGTKAEYSTGSSQAFLWGKDYGTGWLINFSNKENEIFGVDNNSCIVLKDGTSICDSGDVSGSDTSDLTSTGNYNSTEFEIQADDNFGILDSFINKLIDNRVTQNFLENIGFNVTSDIKSWVNANDDYEPDTNESVRVNTMTDLCGSGNYTYGFDDSGNIQCREDVSGGEGGTGESKWIDQGEWLAPNSTFAENVNVTGNLSVGTGPAIFEIWEEDPDLIFYTNSPARFTENLTVESTKDICIAEGNCLSETGTSSGDISSVNTDGPYLYGGSSSGDVYLYLNDTKNNDTIKKIADERDDYEADTNTQLDDQDAEADVVMANYSLLDLNYSDYTPQSGADYKEGRVYYDSEQQTLVYFNDEEDVTVNIGEELLVRVRNVEGSTIYNGDVVYIVGSSGDNPTVKLAKSDNLNTSRLIGVVTEQSINNNGVGYVTTFGRVRGLDTSSYSAGDIVYVSDVEKGNFTSSKPVNSNVSFRVGTVIRSHASEGQVFINPDREIDNFRTGCVIFANGDGELSQDCNFSYNTTNNVLSADYFSGNGTNIFDILWSNIKNIPDYVISSTIRSWIDGNFTVNSNRITSVNDSKLDVDDQRYNETGLVNSVNTSTNINNLFAEDLSVDLFEADTNCSEDNSCPNIHYDSEVTPHSNLTKSDIDGFGFTLNAYNESTLPPYTNRTDEEIQDQAGGMWTGNTETRVTVTYQDSDGTIDIEVDDMNDDVPEQGDFGNAEDLNSYGGVDADKAYINVTCYNSDCSSNETATCRYYANGATEGTSC